MKPAVWKPERMARAVSSLVSGVVEGERKAPKSMRGMCSESWETAVVMWGVEDMVVKVVYVIDLW
jgi:hypothetical protein